MKKTMLSIVLALAASFTIATAQSITAATTFTESGVTSEGLAAVEAALQAETNIPAGTSFQSMNVFKNKTTGLYTVTAYYR